MDTDSNNWVSDVLGFWFETLTPKDWFEVNEKTDEIIKQRFSGLHERLYETDTSELAGDPEMALAAIIVLDQFSRNMFRRTGKAFASDARALAIAKAAVAKDFVSQHPENRRMFFHMPFMHSENLADQDRCVELFTAAGDENGAKHAREHRDIIARFGRFPHRNKVLGRTNTAEETEFLEGHSGFGQ
jgi:uncharacterized protein (DUF924 family)